MSDPQPNNVDETVCFHRLRLAGGWQVQPIPLDADIEPASVSGSQFVPVPETAHLQPILYPDAPFWGEHLRAINEQAWLYRRLFSAPATPYQRARLCFEGVDHFADVWLNGHFLGHHEGHFAPFAFDITPIIAPENELLVRVTSPWDQRNPQGSYPTDHVIRGLVKGLYEHGEGVIPPDVNALGIWRPTWLLLDQGVSVDHVRIRTELDGQVQLRLTVHNAREQHWRGSLGLDIEPENHDGAGARTRLVVDLPPGVQSVEHTLQVPEPRLWWSWDQGLPNLYRLTVCLHDGHGAVLDTKTEWFGIRTVRLERAPQRFTYYLNERPVFLRGSAYIPGLYLAQCDREALERDIRLARETNLNLLRVHTHVSLPELYDLCDRLGMLIWQDFELNWIHDCSPAFEARASVLQRDMIGLLGNHPSIITWACHNEPTMLFTRRENLEQSPDPALYADAIEQDPTRPVFLCSGQMEADWGRAGDAHTYYGALWTKWYTDIYRHHFRLNTEFGFEAPADIRTLQTDPVCWERLKHLEHQVDELWAYQGELIQFHVEHLRRLRAAGSAGYIHFWLADLVPQVGCGIFDSRRLPKGGYEALRRASQPLQVALEHDGRRLYALWVFNDTTQAYDEAILRWTVANAAGDTVLEGQAVFDVQANASQQVMRLAWRLPREAYARVQLTLCGRDGAVLARNLYRSPLQPMSRPQGYPWKFDPFLGVKVFDRPNAPSLADQTSNPIVRRVPLALRENIAEWVLRQQLPPRLLSLIARIIAPILGGSP